VGDYHYLAVVIATATRSTMEDAVTDPIEETDDPLEGMANLLDAAEDEPDVELARIGAEVGEAADQALEDINPANPHLFSQNRWQDHFARLRAEDPVHLNEIDSAGRYWSLTKYDDVRAVDGNWEDFSSARGISLGAKPREGVETIQDMVRTFIAMDPPEHTQQRKTVRSVAAPSNLRNIEPLIRERTIAVLDSLPEGETFDWVDTVSIELTTLMLATLFDFPLEDRRKLTRWSDVVFAVPEPGGLVETNEQKVHEIIEMAGYFGTLWEERVGSDGLDLITMMANGEATKDQDPLVHVGNLLLLIVGGNDTTRNSMTGGVYGLNKYPDQYDKLTADPSLISNLVPEVIRWQTPLPYMRRTANRDCEIGGKQILKDDQILMWYLSANRDEDVFENAEAIDLERPNADRHLSFGYGIHYCMGSRLAELQLRVLWEEILPRFERIEIQDEPDHVFSTFVKGYSRLPVTVTRR
jgi:cytochrome P450